MNTTNLTTATIEVSEDEHQQILASCRAAEIRAEKAAAQPVEEEVAAV